MTPPTPTQHELNQAYQRMLALQRAQAESLAMITGAVFIAGLMIADFMLGFALSDPIMAGFEQALNWVTG